LHRREQPQRAEERDPQPDLVPAIDVRFVEEHDDVVGPLGFKGLGEIGIVGVAAASADAAFHATGRRIPELPITLDKLLRIGVAIAGDRRARSARRVGLRRAPALRRRIIGAEGDERRRAARRPRDALISFY
jgi:hypothetical protein